MRAPNIPPIPPFTPFTPRPERPREAFDFEETRQEIKTEPLGGGGGITHPFQITDVTNSATMEIQVRFGTVNDDIPDNVATDIVIADDATNYIFITCTIDIDGVITDTDIDDNTTGRPAHSDYAAYILLGTVVCASGAVTTINQAVTHSLRFEACDRAVDGETLTTAGIYKFWGV